MDATLAQAKGRFAADGERISTNDVFDALEVPMRRRASETVRLSKLMRLLGWTNIRARGLNPGSYCPRLPISQPVRHTADGASTQGPLRLVQRLPPSDPADRARGHTEAGSLARQGCGHTAGRAWRCSASNWSPFPGVQRPSGGARLDTASCSLGGSSTSRPGAGKRNVSACD